MFKLTIRQHSQILGWALIGFGIGNAIDLVRFLLSLGPSGVSAGSGAVFASLLSPLIYAIVGIIAGIPAFDDRFPHRGMLTVFAVIAFLSFPLGTFLSIYALLYVFVINPEPEPEPVPKAAAEPE